MKKVILLKYIVASLLFILTGPLVFSQNSWIRKQDLPGNARQGAVAFAMGTKGYVASGYNGTNALADLYEWDQSTGIWTAKANMSGSRFNASGISIGTKGYVWYGADDSYSFYQSYDKWDQSTNAWVSTTLGGATPALREMGVAFTIGTKVYIGSGKAPNGGLASDFWEWDQIANVWTQKAFLGNNAQGMGRYSAFGFSIGTLGYIGGGLSNITNNNSLMKDFWEWNPATNVWVQKADFANGLGKAGAVSFVIDNYPYVVTGVSSNGSTQDVWLWSQSLNTWKQCPDFKGDARVTSCAFSIGHKGYIATGVSVSSGNLKDFYEYNATNNIITGNLSILTFPCSGTTISVPYTIVGTFNAGNIFTAQLSDSYGQWGNPTSLGSISSTSAGTITATIPSGLNSSLLYRVRVVSTNVAVIGTDNGININVAGGWAQKADFGGGIRNRGFGFAIGGKGYMGGGYDGSTYRNDLWEWDQTTNVWTQKANCGVSVGRPVGFSIGTKGYVATGLNNGGAGTAGLWEWDQATNTWNQKADFAGGPRSSAVAFTIGTKAYVGTGIDASGAMVKDFWEWDQTTNVWTQKSSFGGIARGYASGFSIGTKGYIGQGLSTTGYLKDFWEWDQATNAWTRKADYIGSGLVENYSFAINGNGFVGGGWSGGPASTDFYTYNPSSDTWIRNADNAFVSVGAMSFVINNRGYVGCGASSITTPSQASLYEFSASAACVNGFVVGSANFPVITTGAVSGNIFPTYGAISIPFTVSGAALPSGNVFIAELSDVSGNFGSYNISLGTLIGTTSGIINGFIPYNIYPGNAYRVRVSCLAGIVGTGDNGSNISITNTHNSVLFDNVDDRITIPHISAYNILQTDFAVEAWVKFGTGTSGQKQIISKRAAGNATGGFFVSAYSGTRLLLQIDGQNVLSNLFASIYDGNCHHIAVVRSSTNVTFYLDGVAQGSSVNNGSINSTFPLIIGYDYYDNIAANAQISDVRFWNSARTVADINNNKSLYLSGSTTGLVGSWQLDEGAGQIAYDYSSKANHGTLGTNSTAIDAQDPKRNYTKCYNTAPVENAIVLDGVDDRVTLPHHYRYNWSTGDFTVELWIKGSVGGPLLSQRTSGTDGFVFMINNNALLLQVAGVPNIVSTSFSTSWDGNCHHVAVTRQGTTITFYLDGTARGTNTIGSTKSVNSTGPMYIGYDAVDNNSCHHTINSVKFWNVALSATQIGNSFNKISPPGSSNLLGEFNFSESGDQRVYDWGINNHGYLGATSNYDVSDPIRSNISCFNGDRIAIADTYEEVRIDTVGTKGQNFNALIAPNPFENETTIYLAGEEGSSSDIIISDINGKIIYQKNLLNNNAYPIGNELPIPGMYFVAVQNMYTGKQQVFKITKIK
jgi:hypothetical protein